MDVASTHRGDPGGSRTSAHNRRCSGFDSRRRVEEAPPGRPAAELPCTTADRTPNTPPIPDPTPACPPADPQLCPHDARHPARRPAASVSPGRPDLQLPSSPARQPSPSRPASPVPRTQLRSAQHTRRGAAHVARRAAPRIRNSARGRRPVRPHSPADGGLRPDSDRRGCRVGLRVHRPERLDQCLGRLRARDTVFAVDHEERHPTGPHLAECVVVVLNLLAEAAIG